MTIDAFAELLEPADLHVAQRLSALGKEADDRVTLAVALAVRAVRVGRAAHLLPALTAEENVALPLTVRGVPIAPPVRLRQRLTPLANPRVLAPLGTTLLMVCAFNVVYIFSSAITAPATGGSNTLLAVLLLSYGAAGVIGNLIAGPVTDRYGSRFIGPITLGGQAVALAALLLTGCGFEPLYDPAMDRIRPEKAAQVPAGRSA